MVITDNWCNSHFYQFKGFDYSELCWCWQMPINNYSKYKEEITLSTIEYIITKCINSLSMNWKLTYFEQKAIKDIRKYILILSKYNCLYSQPIWKGLSKIKDDLTLLTYFNRLLPFAWS